jgi:pimeloyl-ACP methyl ester carboxylesterase
MNVMKPSKLKNAAWFDASEYPFESKYLQIGPHQMHYIDEGKGPTILFVHGTPTWSFLYRKQIKALSGSFRCVAMDHIGFGLSEKPEDALYSPEWHSQNLEKLVDTLKLKDITLVVHDFGGPIGLSFAIRRPDLVTKVVLLNTFLWETANNPAAQKVNRIVRSALGRFLYLRMNASPNFCSKVHSQIKGNSPSPSIGTTPRYFRTKRADTDFSSWQKTSSEAANGMPFNGNKWTASPKSPF